jgi:hypothetical protein
MEMKETQSLLGKLFADSKLYTTGKAYQELLEFATKLRNFSSFKATRVDIGKNREEPSGSPTGQ